MAAVAMVTMQKELFKTVAEILSKALAAGSLISKSMSGEEEGEETPQQVRGWGWDIAGSGDRGFLPDFVPLQAVLRPSLLSFGRRGPLGCLDLERIWEVR